MGVLICPDDKVYVAVTKQSGTYAEEESYMILSGTTELVTSQPFATNELRTDEYCLTASTNNQYTFRMKDVYATSGDSWINGSWVSVAGVYGNVVLKNYMTEMTTEDIPLSLYYPIMKTQQWKTFSSTSSIASDWFAVNFSDGNWQQVTLGSAPAVTGTQYFRKQFAGIPSMAAYEARFNYRYGIIAYVNGMEIYRDHMAAGTVTPATASSGAYNTYEYHGVIRPAAEIEESNTVLAVELHFPAAEENAVEFDAFVASVAPSMQASENTHCFIYPYPVAITTSSGSNSDKIFNFGKGDYYSSTLPTYVNYELSGSRAHINGLRIWPYTYVGVAPTSFKWQGATSSASSYSDVIAVTGATFQSNTYQTFYGLFGAKAYPSYRFVVEESAGNQFNGVEVQPVVCHDGLPSSLEFSPNSYSVNAQYEEVSIRPTITEFTSCSIQPEVPAGLTFNPTSCTLSGVPSGTIASTIFTVTSNMAGQNYQGTFTLQATACSGTMVHILRTYKSGAQREAFSIKDQATQQVVLSVELNSDQVNNQDKVWTLCLTGTKYEIDVDCSQEYWHSNSFMFVHAMLYGSEYETIARLRYDVGVGVPTDRIFNAQWAVAPQQAWQYKMGEVPANWQTEAGWTTASIGTFPASTNQIQLYKNTFTVTSLDNVAGFTLSLRYIYGCVVYMNGQEVFRNGVNGDLTAASIGLNAYTNLLYRQISLPVKTMAVGDQPSVNYLQQGSNTIAIAIVAQTASQTNSVFDCAVRLVLAGSRVFDYTLARNAVNGNGAYALHHYKFYEINGASCTNNLDVTFDNDRREWLSSVTLYLYYTQTDRYVQGFTLKARNTGLEEWTTIKTVEGLTWSLAGETKKLWLENSKPYNQYRFENFNAGNLCSWRLGTLDLSMDVIPATVPELSYPTPIVLSKDVEMGEVYPASELYYEFSVTPALPTGLALDPFSGKISGTVHSIIPASTYQITAKKVGGGTSTASITISVDICTGGKSLITLVARMDGWPEEGSYTLYSGKGTSGQVVQSVPGFKVANGLNYGDFCVAHGLYTLELKDAEKDGWANPAGYYLTVDVGTMIFDMGQMPRNVVSQITLFSSYLPFQIEYDDWKFYNIGDEPAENWMAVDFDDSAWQTVKAAAMGNHNGVTAYVRREVNIPALEDYHVLNVRVKYTGGLAVYFNGRKVARFNLAETFDASTEANAPHDASAFAKFHIVLPTAGAVAGKNVIAFEIHRATSDSAVVFDATGVFGVNDCSVVVDSFAAIDASPVSGCRKEDLLDLNPTTFGYISNTAGSYLAWTVENLEGSKWNSFALQTNGEATGYSFSIYTRWEESEQYLSALAVTNQAVMDRTRSTWDMPVGIAGFKQFRFEIDTASTGTVSTNAYMFLYCKPAGTGSCPAVGDFPSVGEGQISPSTCPDGFRGYAYRECSGGQLGEVKMDKCEYRLPGSLQYENNNMVFVLGTQSSSGVPTYRNIIEEFYMQESTPLPEGFTLNPTTGEITGKPTATMDVTTFTVRGKNAKGETFVAISISVRKGVCQPEGVFERTEVGETAVYECSQQGSYVGTQKRACVLGEKDGVWEKASGFCTSVMVIVLLVVVVIVIIVVVVFLLMRTTRSAKAVGGVKGGKVAKKTVQKSVGGAKGKAVKV